MELAKVFVCLSMCVLYCSAAVINETLLNSTDVNSDTAKLKNKESLQELEEGHTDILDTAEVISDTGDQTPDARELTPEDEEMVILKMQELGGLLDAKDIADIKDEEQAIEDLEENIPEEENLKFEPIPMPTDFDSYDRNGDGYIEIAELTEVTGAFENVEEAFKASDSDRDGFIDKAEFRHAPWDLAGTPPEVGIIGQK